MMQFEFVSELSKVVSKKEAIITSQVYLELCEIKRYHDIEYSFNCTLKKICISAKKNRLGPICVFVPVAVNEDLNFLKLRNILQLFPNTHIFIAIVQSDSTCVYYQLADNLLEPVDTTAKHLKENKQTKLDDNLKKNRDLLEHSALLGVKLTLK